MSNFSFSCSVFKRLVLQTRKNQGLFGRGVLCTTCQKFRLVQIQSICRRQIKCVPDIEFCFENGRRYCGKMRKCWLPAFAPLPTQ